MKFIIALIVLSGIFQCSKGNPTGHIKIVGGEDAELGQFPHQVLWAYNGNVFCGGSIYNTSTIITAAHCCKVFEDGEQLHGQLELTSIMAGRIDIDDIVNGQEKSVKSYLIHPDYLGVSDHINDICLLTLENELEFNYSVNAIGLNTEIVEVGTKCIVSGWGATTVSFSIASN